MRLSNIALAVSAQYGGLFKPSSLFTTGVNGAWYDPSDLSTLYQNAAGTTPVTAMEQPVGLMLDKSKGLVLGPELISTPLNFTDSEVWTSAATSVTQNTFTIGSAGGVFTAANKTVSGKSYRLQLIWSATASVTMEIRNGNSSGSPLVSSQTGTSGTLNCVLPSAATAQVYLRGVGGATYTITSFSVKELPGNHAFNPSGNSANFPVLSARYNLQAGSQVDSGWVGQATTPPTVTNSVSYLGESCVAVTFGPLNLPGYANSRAAYYANDVITILGQRYITSFNVSLSRDLTGGESIVVYYTGANGLATATINAANSSSFVGQWNRITTVAVTAVVGGAVRIYAYNAQTLTSDVTVYINKADLRVSNDALNQPAYQRVNTASDYDTVGFKPYLSFNGVNQWLQTNSIDFSYGDKMFVCAGVRKLSSSGSQIIAEFSQAADDPANNGCFYFTTNELNSGGSSWFLNGTSYTRSITPAVSVPITEVNSVLFDFSKITRETETIARINGIQQTITGPSASEAGIGPFGNYPLYIGARAGSSLWFNGRLYGLVIAGKQASAAEITDTESWLNQKTGAY